MIDTPKLLDRLPVRGRGDVDDSAVARALIAGTTAGTRDRVADAVLAESREIDLRIGPGSQPARRAADVVHEDVDRMRPAEKPRLVVKARPSAREGLDGPDA